MKYVYHSILFVLAFLLSLGAISAQEAQYKVAAIGFYNLENLFDTENDTLINDEDFLPDGKRSWTLEKYQEKQANMAYVISQMGTSVSPSGVSILGVAEIENRKVLEDLVSQPTLKDRNYQIVHHDSPDRRGIDVGLIYNPAHFTVLMSEALPVNYILEDLDTLKTRDVLHVKGILENDTISVLVNHWPSRWGGEKRSAPKRQKAADVCRVLIDSLQTTDPDVKVILIGDLNDDPTSKSVVKNLRSVGKKSKMTPKTLFNPMHDYYRRGLGSNAYRDGWSLFDQILVSPGLIDTKQDGYFYFKAVIFNKKYLIQRNGKFKGYPFRTFSFDKYQGGYSDHFPVIVFLAKKV